MADWEHEQRSFKSRRNETVQCKLTAMGGVGQGVWRNQRTNPDSRHDVVHTVNTWTTAAHRPYTHAIFTQCNAHEKEKGTDSLSEKTTKKNRCHTFLLFLYSLENAQRLTFATTAAAAAAVDHLPSAYTLTQYAMKSIVTYFSLQKENNGWCEMTSKMAIETKRARQFRNKKWQQLRGLRRFLQLVNKSKSQCKSIRRRRENKGQEPAVDEFQLGNTLLFLLLISHSALEWCVKEAQSKQDSSKESSVKSKWPRNSFFIYQINNCRHWTRERKRRMLLLLLFLCSYVRLRVVDFW